MEKPFENKDDFDWEPYYEQIAGDKHSRSLEIAVTKLCKEKGEALDIGAGNLRDTKFLLENGFEVTAVDPSPTSIEYASKLNNASLTMIQDKIGGYTFPENHFVLVNAQSILFHLPKERFDSVMENIRKSLRSGGVFCGDFLGTSDEWNKPESNKTFLTKEQIEDLLKGFDIKMLKETEKDANFAYSVVQGTNETKHWHYIKVIAIKK